METRYQLMCYAKSGSQFDYSYMFIIKHRKNVTSFVSKYQSGKYCLCIKYVLNQYIYNKSPLLLYQLVFQSVFHVLPLLRLEIK